ncbi:MAG: hypothetical protein IPM16_14455 [Chloroflexi bacterium]|nr:hypothetical protein [Chloroflexota bacterium]
MLKMTFDSPARTVFEDRRIGLRFAAMAFTVVSAIALGLVLFQFADAAAAGSERLSDWRVLLVFGLYLVLAVLFVAGGMYALLLSRGSTLLIDRINAELTLISPRGFRMLTERIGLYSVRSVQLAGEEHVQALALVLVLRDGRVVPLTAGPKAARGLLEKLAVDVQDALSSPPPAEQESA